MKSRYEKSAHIVRSVSLLGLTLPFLLGAGGCPDQDREIAIRSVIAAFVEENVASIEITEMLRVHIYPEVLPAGTLVRPYSPIADSGAPAALQCTGEQGCRLFFMDTDHWAHFAHATVVVLWDPGADQPDQRLRWTPGRWWPQVNETSVFDTVRKREDWNDPADPDPAMTIVYPLNYVSLDLAPDQMDITILRLPPPETSGVGLSVFSAPAACPVWAVLVAGFNDPDDTFDTDVEGMETMLRGHGVPPSHLFVLSPKYDGVPISTAPGETTRLPATHDNVKTVLKDALVNAINSNTNGCENFLFFFSSHGDTYDSGVYLECPGNAVTDANLKSWLAGVPCKTVTVVLEACYSGGFIDPLKSVPATPIVIPDGIDFAQEKRLLFTSTKPNGKSRRDKDHLEGVLDENPGDLGSESMSGYIEAFGTSAANGDLATPVTFADAVGFAEENDLTKLAGLNNPMVFPTDPPQEIVHICPVQPVSPTLEIDLTQPLLTTPADDGQLLRCRCNGFSATVSHLGGYPPPVSTARFYWTDVADPMWSQTGESDFKQIWDSTRLLGSHEEFPVVFEVFWNVGSDIAAGTEITLLAIADSPRSPIPDNPNQQMSLSDLQSDPQASWLKLEVVDPSSCFIFPCGCRTVRCD